jgi:hypothetical protein
VITGAEAFDGTVYRTRLGYDVSQETDTGLLQASAFRLWAFAVMLLTPLSEPFVRLRMVDERCLEAVNSETGWIARLILNPDYTLDTIATRCHNPRIGSEQTFSIKSTAGQTLINEFMVPRRLQVCWDDEPEMEVSPASVELNPTMDDDTFLL